MTPEQAREKFEPTISVLLEQIEAEVVLDCRVVLQRSNTLVDESQSCWIGFGLPGIDVWDAEVEFTIDIRDAWDGNGKRIHFECSVLLDGEETDVCRTMQINPGQLGCSLDDNMVVESQWELFKSMIDPAKIAELIIAHLNKESERG